MKILNLLAAGNTGGIEVLLKNMVLNNTLDNRICCLFDEGEIYQEIKEKTNKIFSLKSLNRDKNAIVKSIVEYCKQEKIDVIVVHHGGINCNLVYMMLKKKLPNIKYVRYFHSSFDAFWEGRNKLLKGIATKIVMQKAMDISDKLIFISRAVQKSFEQQFRIKEEKSVIVYNGIHQSFFQHEVKPHFQTPEVKMIFIGRLEKIKGIDILLKAFGQIYERYPTVQLIIVGEGREEQRLKEIAKEMEAGKNIYFVGRQKYIIQWLDQADIFIYPSICEEGFGISIAEAMARGCIPITFRKGGIPELIQNGKNGLLIEPTDETALAEGVETVIKMEANQKEEIAKNAIRTAKKFSIDNTIQVLQEVYTELLQSKRIDKKEINI